MAATLITAGDALSGLSQTAGNDGTLIVQAGPAGAKLNAIALAADGTPTFLKVPAATAVQSMVRLDTTGNYGSTNTAIRRFTNVRVNQGTDITYADSATLGAIFTINTNGVYGISFYDNFTAASDLGISLNSTQLTTGIGAINAADRIAEATTTAAATRASCSTTHYLKVGDVIRAHTNGTASSTVDMGFTITRVA